MNEYDKLFLKFIIIAFVAILFANYCSYLYDFFKNIINSFSIDDQNLKSNVITILMSIFSSLFTFISIIFLYYNFTNKASIDKLVELLLKIEEFCYTYRNIEFKKQHKIFKEPSNIPQYKSPGSVIKSYYGQYSLELKKHNNNQLFFKKLIKINYIVSIVAILIILYALCVIKFFSLPTIFFIVIVSVLLIFNSYLASETTKFNKELEKFPSTEILLTPTETLDEYCTTNFCIDRNLPLKLFHACTTLNVRPFSEISKIISKSTYLSNKSNYLMINALFPFNINSIMLYYNAEIFKYTHYYESFNIHQIKTPDNYYRFYLITRFPIKDAFHEYNSNKIKLEMDIKLITKNSQKFILTYQYDKNYSSEAFYKFQPIDDLELEDYKNSTIKESDISFN